MSKINRRQFFLLGAAGVGTAVAANWAFARSNRTSPPSSSLYKSAKGLLEVHLEARTRPINLAGKPASLMTYNGQVPAPRLEAKAGDTVRIHFTNNLSQPTNLHYHGLHVSPTGNADNPFLMIPPGESLIYEFNLPQNHPAGTFWYHPHHHGHVAEQLFAGLAGLFIVRGELDKIPEIQAVKEEFLVLKDFDLNESGRIRAPNPMAMMLGREGQLLTTNGRVNPDLSIAKGGLLRLRLLNASPSRFYRLSLENHPFYLIATDSGAIAEPVELEDLLLVPGERAEVLVRSDKEPGQYRLLALAEERSGMRMMGDRGMGSGRGMMGNNSQTPPQVLATLSYQDSVATMPLPQKLIPIETLPEPQTVRDFKLSMAMGMGSGMGMSFTFNGQTFDMDRIDTQVKLNTVEDWELMNVDPSGIAHSFHLHTNPFQIVSRNGQPEAYLAWKDTILVRGGESVRIRIPFRDFAGKTVYHCHILDHEDLGMMGIVNISA